MNNFEIENFVHKSRRNLIQAQDLNRILGFTLTARNIVLPKSKRGLALMAKLIKKKFPKQKPCSCKIKDGRRCFIGCPVYNAGSECGPGCSKKEGGCSNRGISDGVEKHMSLLARGNCGLGVKAEEKIHEGDFLCEYTGVLYHDADNPYYSNSRYAVEFFGDSTLVLEATDYGSIGRYFMHSHEPNAQMYIIRVGNALRIAVGALKSIPPGEEILINYGEGFRDLGIEVCACGDLFSCPDAPGYWDDVSTNASVSERSPIITIAKSIARKHTKQFRTASMKMCKTRFFPEELESPEPPASLLLRCDALSRSILDLLNIRVERLSPSPQPESRNSALVPAAIDPVTSPATSSRQSPDTSSSSCGELVLGNPNIVGLTPGGALVLCSSGESSSSSSSSSGGEVLLARPGNVYTIQLGQEEMTIIRLPRVSGDSNEAASVVPTVPSPQRRQVARKQPTKRQRRSSGEQWVENCMPSKKLAATQDPFCTNDVIITPRPVSFEQGALRTSRYQTRLDSPARVITPPPLTVIGNAPVNVLIQTPPPSVPAPIPNAPARTIQRPLIALPPPSPRSFSRQLRRDQSTVTTITTTESGSVNVNVSRGCTPENPEPSGRRPLPLRNVAKPRVQKAKRVESFSSTDSSSSPSPRPPKKRAERPAWDPSTRLEKEGTKAKMPSHPGTANATYNTRQRNNVSPPPAVAGPSRAAVPYGSRSSKVTTKRKQIQQDLERAKKEKNWRHHESGSNLAQGRPFNYCWTCTHEGCEKIFNHLGNYRRHLESHQNVRDVHCEWEGCELKFNNIDAMREHYETHLPKDLRVRHICVSCRHGYAKGDDVRKHMQKKNSCEFRRYVTMNKDKTLKWGPTLKGDMLPDDVSTDDSLDELPPSRFLEKEPYRFQCVTCKRKFPTREKCLIHMRFKSNSCAERRYVCIFKDKRQLWGPTFEGMQSDDEVTDDEVDD